jgi:hypothetical protein
MLAMLDKFVDVGSWNTFLLYDEDDFVLYRRKCALLFFKQNWQGKVVMSLNVFGRSSQEAWVVVVSGFSRATALLTGIPYLADFSTSSAVLCIGLQVHTGTRAASLIGGAGSPTGATVFGVGL